MSNWSGDLDYPVSYAIYYPTNGIEMNSCRENTHFQEWREIKPELFSNIENLNYRTDWQVMNLNGKTISWIFYKKIQLDALLLRLKEYVKGGSGQKPLRKREYHLSWVRRLRETFKGNAFGCLS